jgi:hypothetical protein
MGRLIDVPLLTMASKSIFSGCVTSQARKRRKYLFMEHIMSLLHLWLFNQCVKFGFRVTAAPAEPLLAMQRGSSSQLQTPETRQGLGSFMYPALAHRLGHLPGYHSGAPAQCTHSHCSLPPKTCLVALVPTLLCS